MSKAKRKPRVHRCKLCDSAQDLVPMHGSIKIQKKRVVRRVGWICKTCLFKP